MPPLADPASVLADQHQRGVQLSSVWVSRFDQRTVHFGPADAFSGNTRSISGGKQQIRMNPGERALQVQLRPLRRCDTLARSYRLACDVQGAAGYARAHASRQTAPWLLSSGSRALAAVVRDSGSTRAPGLESTHTYREPRSCPQTCVKNCTPWPTGYRRRRRWMM